MQRAQELFREGKLTEAISHLQSVLRDKPTDKRARTFLFELLCFAGEFDRARKQLGVLAEDTQQTKLGVSFYLAALSAEMDRQAWYQLPAPPVVDSTGEDSTGGSVRGVCDGVPFSGIHDLDSRLGGSLEFLTAGKYHRVAFSNLARLEFSPTVRARDAYWRVATLEFTAEMGSTQLDSILVPVLYPQTYLFEDDLTRLGRTTDFAETAEGEEIPCGQRILVIGGREIPILEITSIDFDGTGPAGGGSV
jgi:type VI secretion system protein ImpE